MFNKHEQSYIKTRIKSREIHKKESVTVASGGPLMVAQWLRYCAANRKVAGLIPDGVLEFFINIILPIALWPWVDSASNRNEYQEHFLGGKGGRCLRLTTLSPSCAVVMQSGNLNFLEPSGPLQAGA
jgi:hypothetical protein